MYCRVGLSGLSASELHNQCSLTNFFFPSIFYLLLESCTLTGFLEKVTTYSRCFLTEIGANLSDIKLNSTLWRNLCNLRIFRVKPTRRGCRGGQRKQQLLQTSGQARELHFKSLLSANKSFSPFLVSKRIKDLNSTNLHTSSLNIQADTFANNNSIKDLNS